MFALFGISPILVALGAGMIAQIYGFELNEARPPDSSDLGRRLYQFGVAGWYFLITVPVAIFLSVVYAATLFFLAHRRKRSIS